MNRVTYRDRAAEQELQILRSILSEIDKQKESVIENAVAQALTKENSATNVLDDVNGKIEKTSQLANDVITRFHQKHPEFYAVQECPCCGKMCLYKTTYGVLDEITRIKYECGSCDENFEKETAYFRHY